MSLGPRVVVVHRATELNEVVATHSTRGQAAFRLKQEGRDLDEVETRHQRQQTALAQVSAAVPVDWRRADVERDGLDRFVFGPEDIVVTVGPDGLVANAAKYLDGQPVLGVNPEPGHNPGVLARHPPDAVAGLLPELAADRAGSAGPGGAGAGRPRGGPGIEALTMVEARTGDNQVLTALNEIYVGQRTHQSARYVLGTPNGPAERQSSSGALIGTGTGATGWLLSAWRERNCSFDLPAPTDVALAWFVREAWPSPSTGTGSTSGLLQPGERLAFTAESDLVVFGDGIENDALHISWGQRVMVGASSTHLHLVS